ncbi:Crp/Fnr family transcriptional regulator [Brucella gallinifaecis]|uniref:Crp/Fnr family transcriptional regulator n=1 Tax=Brucella gallinifaecis TaxID=215590 RepID=A0A502BIQ3_9HYPH|nr:helix-turn-helix domain-containing protein [Brucella gallinifaecis]TPF74024.1 Crp/Fnr family transcriptional regulator [Brucella gallinifaecis]
MTRQPRRLDLQARLPTWMMHLPLEQMDQMAYTNPRVIAQFAQILMATTEVLVRIVYDLQVQNSARRIASVLQRISGPANGVVALSQEELGEMACATRRQVSIALKLLAEEKIVTVQYAKIIINDQHKLKIFMKDE